MPPNWTKPYLDYLLNNILPDDPVIARKIEIKASHFSIREKQVYNIGFLTTWLRRIAHAEG